MFGHDGCNLSVLQHVLSLMGGLGQMSPVEGLAFHLLFLLVLFLVFALRARLSSGVLKNRLGVL